MKTFLSFQSGFLRLMPIKILFLKVRLGEVDSELLERIRKTERKRVVRQLWIKYAGAAAVAVIIGIVGYWMGGHQATVPLQYYSYITGNSISSFELPDGTEISLNKNSKLSYSSSYGEQVREVSLDGEGFFTVTKDKEKAFVVDLNGSKISVLGTVFNVKNYKKEDITTATLVEGSIRFETPDQQIVLKPDQQLVFNKSNNKIDMTNVSTDLVTAWKSHLIKYRSVPFREFLDMLKERYEVEIILSNEVLGDQKVTGSFDESLTVDQILDLMKKNLVFRWKKQGESYVIN